MRNHLARLLIGTLCVAAVIAPMPSANAASKFDGMWAVKTQIWIAVSVYVLVAIVKKRLQLSASLYEILQILSLTMFERMPIDQLLSLQPTVVTEAVSPNQLTLFD